MPKKTPEEVLAILAETPLTGLIQALQSGEYQSPSDPVSTEDTVIGELNDREKAIYSALTPLDTQMSELITAHNRAITALRAGETVDQLSVRINQTKINVIKHLLEGLQDLMWLSVKERIGTPATEATLLQVRENFKVVSCSRKQAIAELIMAIFQS